MWVKVTIKKKKCNLQKKQRKDEEMIKLMRLCFVLNVRILKKKTRWSLEKKKKSLKWKSVVDLLLGLYCRNLKKKKKCLKIKIIAQKKKKRKEK